MVRVGELYSLFAGNDRWLWQWCIWRVFWRLRCRWWRWLLWLLITLHLTLPTISNRYSESSAVLLVVCLRPCYQKIVSCEMYVRIHRIASIMLRGLRIIGLSVPVMIHCNSWYDDRGLSRWCSGISHSLQCSWPVWPPGCSGLGSTPGSGGLSVHAGELSAYSEINISGRHS